MKNNFDLKKFLIENKLTRLSEGPSAQQVVDMIRDTKFNSLNNMPKDENLAKQVGELLNKPENKDAKAKLEKLAKSLKEDKGLKSGLLAAILSVAGLFGGVGWVYNTAYNSGLDLEEPVPDPNAEANAWSTNNTDNTVSYSDSAVTADPEKWDTTTSYSDNQNSKDWKDGQKVKKKKTQYEKDLDKYGDFWGGPDNYQKAQNYVSGKKEYNKRNNINYVK
jgi:hypothetical protein